MEFGDKATSAIRKMQAFYSLARSARLTASVRNSCIENQEPILQLVGLDGSDNPSQQGITGISGWIARIYRKFKGGTAEALVEQGIQFQSKQATLGLPYQQRREGEDEFDSIPFRFPLRSTPTQHQLGGCDRRTILDRLGGALGFGGRGSAVGGGGRCCRMAGRGRGAGRRRGSTRRPVGGLAAPPRGEKGSE